MKICHMTSAHNQKDVRIFYKECTSLAKAGYEVYLVTCGESCDINNVHIVGIGDVPVNRFNRMTSGARKVYKKALELNCDVYHFHDPELLPYGLKLKRKGKKVVFDSHENTVEQIKEKEWIPNFARKVLYTLFDRYQKYVCRKIDAIISVTPHICDYFKEINPATYMITNYPIIEPLPKSNARLRRLCFAGGISEQWCHRDVICAIENIDDCEYVLCGKGEGEYFDGLKSLPGWEKVSFKGLVSHDDINKILSTCQVGISILKYNNNTAFKKGTLGNTKIFEEMMAGLPVVCTDFLLWREFVDKYNCGICVNPQNVDEIADAIRYMLDNPKEARRMGDNGRRAVVEEFNWSTEEKKLIELYKKLC